MDRAAMLDFKEKENEILFSDMDLWDTSVNEEPSCYHAGNRDAYFDLQETQERHYMLK